MKTRLEAERFAAFHHRGVPRIPDGVDRFATGQRGNSSLRGPFPHGRFYLWTEFDCPRLVDQGLSDIIDLQVRRFYDGVVPWLAYGMGDPAGRQQATDLVDLVDEFMDRDGELHGCVVPWPLRDVLAVFADVLTTIMIEQRTDTVIVWDIALQDRIIRRFGEICAVLERHEACCLEVLVNVHWW